MCPTTSLSLMTFNVKHANLKQPIWPNFNGTLGRIILVPPPFLISRPETPRQSSTMAEAPPTAMEWALPKRSLEEGADQGGGKKGHHNRSRSKKKRGNSPKGGPAQPAQLGAASSASGVLLPAGGPAQGATPARPPAQKYQNRNDDDNLLQLVGKLSLNTAQRNREIEGATTHCHEALKDHAMLIATGTAGKDYSAAVLGKGTDHKYGPPHVHKFLASVKYMSEELQWPDHMKEERQHMLELYKEAASANMGSLSEMCKMYKTKDTVAKKDKTATTKIIWATNWKFNGTVVDDDGVAADGRQKEVDTSLLLCKAFQQMKFEKSMSGPPPSVIEKKVSELLRKK